MLMTGSEPENIVEADLYRRLTRDLRITASSRSPI